MKCRLIQHPLVILTNNEIYKENGNVVKFSSFEYEKALEYIKTNNIPDANVFVDTSERYIPVFRGTLPTNRDFNRLYKVEGLSPH